MRTFIKTAAKAMTYRVVAALETFGLAWFLTGHAGTAAGAVAATEVFKVLTYGAHEMAWEWAGAKAGE